MARESKTKSQLRQVVRVGQFDQRLGQPELNKVPVQRDTFNTPKHVREIGGGCTDGASDIAEAHGSREMRFKEQFRVSDQSACGSGQL
jgi:hypothetical protein